MRLLHYLELQNFKRFGSKQRITLDHPSVLIGPNNCGKTTAIQAIALWSQAVKSWIDARRESKAEKRTGTALNRLSIVAVPVRRTRYFWHNTVVRSGTKAVPLVITVGVEHDHRVWPVTMEFRNDGEDIVYCTPDATTVRHRELLEAAARIEVELLYPMSGLDIEEPVLQPGRIAVLLGQGQTAQVLRNLCLQVHRTNPEGWREIVHFVHRLFALDLGDPQETSRGSIELTYSQAGVKEPLDLAQSGRGLHQTLLILAYLNSHRRSVLLIDEPDAHLEILRQKQIYVLLRDVAARNESQVILVTHSEVVLGEAYDRNLTLLLDGKAEDLAARTAIHNALKHYGTENYVRARELGHILYIEGGTDLDMLRALARRLRHPIADRLDGRLNAFYVQNNYPEQSTEAELERVEGGFGIEPRNHFGRLRSLVPSLRGLAILDNDGKSRSDADDGRLLIAYWRRYEAENYFITPEVLRSFALVHYREMTLFQGHRKEIDETLDALALERVFDGDRLDFAAWKKADPEAARVIWDAKTERRKLSDFAEDFFRRLAATLGHEMILRKGDLHTLVEFVDPARISSEVSTKLDLLATLLTATDSDRQVADADSSQ